MRIKYLFSTAISGLAAHKFRSFLTILGIIIGITSIIIVMSTGEGAQNLILGQIQGIGTKTIAVIPGREPKGPSDSAQIFSDSLKEKDIELLRKKSNVPAAQKIMPILFGGDTGVYGSETYRLTVFGGSEFIADVFDIKIESGAFFSEDDVRSRADVAVIGSKVRDELFGSDSAIGKKIRIKGRPFKIIGVMPQQGSGSLFNFDEAAIIPYTSAQQYIFGIKYYHRIIVQAESESVIDETVEGIKKTLRMSHNITDPEKDDFFVQTQADLAERLGTVTTALTLFLVSVAAISLLVAGIGIMNIMLVSVTERTREIGLRKSLGATNRDVMLQFLLEAVVLTGLGGIVGIIMGLMISFAAALAINYFTGLPWKFVFPLDAIVIGLMVSTTVGLVFGIYPARRASLKSPIEALRHE